MAKVAGMAYGNGLVRAKLGKARGEVLGLGLRSPVEQDGDNKNAALQAHFDLPTYGIVRVVEPTLAGDEHFKRCRPTNPD